MMPQRRTLSLLDMLVWTYRDQQAHRYLRDPADWFWYVIGKDAAVELDERPAVHRDAVLVHANVMELEAFALIDSGVNAEMPKRCDEPARCVPLEADRWGDYGRAFIDGKLTDYKISVAERISIVTPIFERRGRKRVVHVGDHVETVDVRYCPIVIEPSPEWREAKNAEHAAWVALMAALATRLRDVQFAAHVVRDLGRWQRRGAVLETTTLDNEHGFRVHLRPARNYLEKGNPLEAAFGVFVSTRKPVSGSARERMRQAALGRNSTPGSVAKMAAAKNANAWRQRPNGTGFWRGPVGVRFGKRR